MTLLARARSAAGGSAGSCGVRLLTEARVSRATTSPWSTWPTAWAVIPNCRVSVRICRGGCQRTRSTQVGAVRRFGSARVFLGDFEHGLLPP